MNTSEFSPVDTDGDGIADAWETRGIDYDEDGVIDLKLANADPMRKDIYVELDAMTGCVPDMSVDSGTLDSHGQFNNDACLSAPVGLVQNPNGLDGVFVHLESGQEKEKKSGVCQLRRDLQRLYAASKTGGGLRSLRRKTDPTRR